WGNQPVDRVEIPSRAASRNRESSLLQKIGLGAAAVLALTGTMSQAAQAGEAALRSQNFEVVERLVYAKGEEAPCGESIDLLKEYSQTDFGAAMFSRVASDALEAVEDGMLTNDGEVTIDGQFEGYQPFRISCGQSGQGGPNGIVLPASYPEIFRHSGQTIHPLAIIHHEMGHTRYGLPAGPADIVTDEHGSRYHVEHEMEIVRRFENPVREQYGYAPRTSYTNHLGESAMLPSP
ncbi:MAG: hypothetical protein KC800_26590, partial [Candidatus Eremiobacteraeota bacterium]|nr:hypothetical protein [Candidatus Eremiobacteraeota bacterium]